MTIGIGAIGKNAGLAVWKALNSVERVTSGSIGGFATFVIFNKDGKVKYYCTQRGGSKTLFTEGDSVVDYPPDEVIEAVIAGVISSGPDRPEPLESLLPAKEGVGFITGHRIPSAIGKNGISVNMETLKIMEKGESSNTAVNKVMSENPNIDAGLIAVDVNGNIGAINSKKVENRLDVASAVIKKAEAKVAVFNNEIYPVKITADLAAAIAMQVMTEERKPDIKITISSGLKVELGTEDKVVVNKENSAIQIFTTDPTILRGKTTCVVPYLGSTVVKNGKKIGILMNEPLTVLDNGIIVELAGQKTIVRDVRKV